MPDLPRPDIARRKVAVIGIAMVISVGYCALCLYLYVPQAQHPNGPFLIGVVIAFVTFLGGALDWFEIASDLIWFGRPPARREERLLGGAVYLLTLMYILLIGWLCYFTGGPIHSPFTVILLTIAILTPFASTSDFARWTVLGAVTLAYLGFTALFDHLSVKPPEVPGALIAVTSLFSVLISVLLEWSRRRAERKAHDDSQKSAV